MLAAMTRVLITGLSGTGKSAVVQELAARGYAAIDLDTPQWSEWIDAPSSDMLTPAPGKDWVWREARVRALLSTGGEGMLFIGGCAENMRQFFPLIDLVILLSAPVATIRERLARRAAGTYGHAEEDRLKIETLIATVEPLLRQSAHHEIDTRRPVSDTVEEVLHLAAWRPVRRASSR